MDSKTQQVLGELKAGKDAQTAAWLSHPTDYADLVASVVTAASGAGGNSIGNTLTTIASTPLYENAETNMLPAVFVSSKPEDENSYPNYLSSVLQRFAQQVTEYKAYASEEQPIIYAPPLPIDTENSHSLAYCFATCRWLVSIDAYDDSTYAADIARLNAVTDCTSMFRDCASLVTLPSTLTFNGLVVANNMFYGCLALTNLPDGFLGQNITSCSSMFDNCINLVSLHNPGSPNVFTLANANGNYIFRNCRKLQSLPDGFDLGNCTSFNRIFYYCMSLLALPSSLTFKMSRINNAQLHEAYNTESQYNAMYRMFFNMGAATGSINNHFVIDEGSTGIKFDLYLHQGGFDKLSAGSVASLFDCLHDWRDDVLEDYNYEDRFPNAEVADVTETEYPTVFMRAEIEQDMLDIPDPLNPTDQTRSILDYIWDMGWVYDFI